MKSNITAPAAYASDSGAPARSVIDEAMEVLTKCMRGQVDPRTADVQRRAALDILGGAMWETLDDGQLDAHLARVIAEVERRRVKGKP